MGFIFYTKGFMLCTGCTPPLTYIYTYIEHHHLSHTKYIHKSFELNTYIYTRHRNIYDVEFKSSQNFAKHNFP